MVRSTPHDRGKGVFWWEPAVAGPLRTRGFFDDEGNALPLVTVFDNSSRNWPRLRHSLPGTPAPVRNRHPQGTNAVLHITC